MGVARRVVGLVLVLAGLGAATGALSAAWLTDVLHYECFAGRCEEEGTVTYAAQRVRFVDGTGQAAFDYGEFARFAEVRIDGTNHAELGGILLVVAVVVAAVGLLAALVGLILHRALAVLAAALVGLGALALAAGGALLFMGILAAHDDMRTAWEERFEESEVRGLQPGAGAFLAAGGFVAIATGAPLSVGRETLGAAGLAAPATALPMAAAAASVANPVPLAPTAGQAAAQQPAPAPRPPAPAPTRAFPPPSPAAPPGPPLRLHCPRCKTTFHIALGVRPRCPNCGFAG